MKDYEVNKEAKAMTNQLRKMLPACLVAMAMTAVSAPIPCVAQEADANHPARLAASRTDDSTASGGPETEAGASNPGTTQVTPQAGGTQGGISALSGHMRSFSRNGPTRESWLTIDLGTKYAKAVVGGFEQGAILGLGVQFTTADLIRFVE